MSEIDLELVRQVVDILNNSGVQEISVRKGDLTITARRSEKAVRPPQPPASAAERAPAEQESKPLAVAANWVGLFHRTEKDAKKPLVEVGSEVQAGQPLGYIETVKLWNEVLSPCAGVVTEIPTREGQPVEYGETLFVLKASISR